MRTDTTEADQKLRETVLAYYAQQREANGLSPLPANPPVVDLIRTFNGKAVTAGQIATHVDVYIEDATGHHIQETLDLSELREFWKQHLKHPSPSIIGSPTQQNNWMMHRARIIKMPAPRLHGAGGTSWDARGSLKNVDGRVVCLCLQQRQNKNGPCDHVLYAYYTGLDNKVLGLSSARPDRILDVKVIVGMGTYILPVRLIRAKDDTDPEKVVKFLIATSEPEVAIRRVALNMDLESRYVMTDDEGLLGYIQHFEDMVRETAVFRNLITASFTRDSALIATAGGCSAYHTPAVRSMVMSALSPSNPLREAWAIGNVASLYDAGALCLGCRQMAVGQHDIPDLSDHPE